MGRAIAQAVSRRPVTAEGRGRSRVIPCWIRGEQSGTGTCLSSSTSVFPCQFHSTGAPLHGKKLITFITGLHNRLFSSFFVEKGPQQKLRTHRSLEAYRATLVTKMNRKVISFFIFPSNGASLEWNWQGKTEVFGGNPVPVPLCPPQIPHGLTPGSNPGLCGGRPATNRLSHGTATQ
jgi:hypothetical protein